VSCCGAALVGCTSTSAPRPGSSSDIERSGGRILLLQHHPVGDIDYAPLSAELWTTRAGCIAVGGDVAVFPPGSRLDPDGSVTVAGHTYTQGSIVSGGSVAGGFTGAPCGKTATYVWIAAVEPPGA